MMDSAVDFEIARKSLVGQAYKTILKLKDTLKDITQEDLYDDKKLNDIITAMFYADKDICQISSVLKYIDAWEENGDPPQLSYKKEG